ncbi:MAG TPA: 30S ribosomal protein S12 methylthiotransferase RimO [Deltaproteobacteria bacterium]|nr:30S ribosomal protein S12 methylthiotransferase RimO [Deltaproteobacteria bacterium]
MKRISIVSLGCHKNLVDSEFICEKLMEAGHTIEFDPDESECVIVNTCSFLTSAVEESIQTILELIDDGKEVICAGCLVSRYGKDLLQELPEVKIFAGPGTYEDLPRAIERNVRYLAPVYGGVVKRSFITTGVSAYVKVSEGCSNHCRYCLIPGIRGELVSKPPSEVLDECRQLAARGVREIILIAQDVGSYGRDLKKADALTGLVEKISGISGVEWIRIMYMHPDSLSESLAEIISDNPKVCPYIDLPVQHIAGGVLEAMGRRGGAGAVIRALDLLRSRMENIWIRSTIMVGHPGEDEGAFEELEEFVSQGWFDHLGVFAYSPEEGSASAMMTDHLDEEIKAMRKERIMAIQQDISRKRLQGLLGEKIPVLVEGYHPETDLLLKGRAAFQAPDVDGHIIINEGTAQFGSFYDVEIIDTMEYDLVGRIV